MKRLNFLFGFILSVIISHSCYSQLSSNFIDSSKLWSVLHYPYYQWPRHTTHYLKIGPQTTVRDTGYFKLMRSDDREHIDWYDYGFIREDSLGRVYYRISEANSEGLIYSNSTQKGDTLIVARRENDIYLSFYEFTVDSIDTILISGKSRKRNLLNGGVEQWIEGIGSLSGPIYSWPGTVGGDGYFLLCFKQNDSLIYMKPSYSDCYDILNSENSINQHKAIQIYPNPVVDCNFNIEFQHLGDYKLSIYNAVSKLIKKYEVTNVQKLEIRDKIQKGLYFIHIYDYSLNREFKEKIIIL